MAAARASEATNPPMRASQELPGDNSDIPVTRREKLFFYKIKLVKQSNALLIDQQLSRHKRVEHEVSFLEHTKVSYTHNFKHVYIKNLYTKNLVEAHTIAEASPPQVRRRQKTALIVHTGQRSPKRFSLHQFLKSLSGYRGF